jgi:hypothetical protein
VGPIESGYGLHLVFVRERMADQVPTLAEVRQASAGILGLLGIMAALFVFVMLVTAFVVALQRPWTRVVVRVAGSWIAAIGLLMLGWSLRGGNGKKVIGCERFGAHLLMELMVLSKLCIDHDIGGG